MFGHVAESVFNTRNVRLQNVPTSITQLVGREQQEKAACTLLLRPDVRLLTLTGTGGIGKTRLSHRIGSNLPSHTHSVYEMVCPSQSTSD